MIFNIDYGGERERNILQVICHKMCANLNARALSTIFFARIVVPGLLLTARSVRLKIRRANMSQET